MANIFKKIENQYDKTAKTLNQVWAILLVLSVGVFLISYVNRSGNTKKTATDNAFLCALTPIEEVLTLNTTNLSTAFNISLINNETDLLQTALSKNGIPAVENPNFGAFAEISPCINSNEPVYVVKYENLIKVYPRKILEQHIVINDSFNGVPVLIAYSPLSNLFNVFLRTYKNEVYTFGVSGYVYKNIDLIFDSKSESLWSIVEGKVIVGSKLGAGLDPISNYELMSFEEAIQAYPEAKYMNFDTGFRINYYSAPFDAYRKDSNTIQKVQSYSEKLEPKSNVLGFIIKKNQYYINPKGLVLPYFKEINIDGTKYDLNISNTSFSLTEQSTKKIIPIFSMYWFVWYDLFPSSSEIL